MWNLIEVFKKKKKFPSLIYIRILMDLDPKQVSSILTEYYPSKVRHPGRQLAIFRHRLGRLMNSELTKLINLNTCQIPVGTYKV
jgi:hypothetical protein